MRFSRDQLVLKALAALSEIADECGENPVPKSLMLRFTLAFTYAASGADPQKLWLWRDFWRHATAPKAEAKPDQFIDTYVRGTGARSALNGICREVGYPPDLELLESLRQGRRSP